MLDLFVDYDHHTLDVSSCDLTTFQTPLGAHQCTGLPQGSTNAIAIFHGDVTFLLEPEIPKVAKPFLNNTAVRSPASCYETTVSDMRVPQSRLPNYSSPCQKFSY
jgi:hypothetical protein